MNNDTDSVQKISTLLTKVVNLIAVFRVSIRILIVVGLGGPGV